MDEPKGNKWLLIISLVIGLSFGVHFMALLTIPSIGFLYYFKNYEKVTIKNFIIANVVVVAVLFLSLNYYSINYGFLWKNRNFHGKQPWITF